MSLGSWQPLSLSNLETKCNGKRYDTWQQRPLAEDWDPPTGVLRQAQSLKGILGSGPHKGTVQ